MWLFAHRKGSTNVVPDGQTFTEQCPTCQQRTRFVEVAITEKYGLFFIDMIKDEERAFRCTRCGDVFDLRDTASAATSASAKPAPAKPAPAQKPVAKPAVDHAAVERVEKKIDDELAELKRRMGK